MSPEIKPYLKEISNLYNKISAFESGVQLKHAYNPVDKPRQYVNEDIDIIIEAMSRELDFTPDELSELDDAMHSGKIDFMGLKNDRGAMPEDELQLLYIISRPFFKSMKHAMNMDNIFWQDGKCPVCGAVPAMSVIEKESKRRYFCSYCGTQGYYNRIGCPGCLTENPGDITIITLEGEEGMRADTCGKCKSYFKTFEVPVTAGHSMDTLDIISIPLDIVVQEKGFRRFAPNSVGLMNML